MSWALEGGEIEKLDKDEEMDYLEIRLQKLESKEFHVRRKSAEALAPYIAENRYIDEVRQRFKGPQPPHPAQVIADGIVGLNSEKNICMSGVQALAHMGPPAAPYAAGALAVLMSHSDEEIRYEAARALGYLGPDAADAASVAMAKQLDADNEQAILVRFTTARSLGLLGPGAAAGAGAALALALEDKDKDVQKAAAVSLGQIGPNAAPYAAKALVKAMLEATFEMRRLAVKSLISMGEAAGSYAAYPTCRVLNRMNACCRHKYHYMKPLRKKPPKMCDKCQAIGPFAQGTDYHCSGGCKWDICKECYAKLQHHDVVLQRLAAEALCAFGAKAVQSCQVYVSHALGDSDEEVRQGARKALEMAGCATAMKGSMALYDGKSHPCNKPNCVLCTRQKTDVSMWDDDPCSPCSPSPLAPMSWTGIENETVMPLPEEAPDTEEPPIEEAPMQDDRPQESQDGAQEKAPSDAGLSEFGNDDDEVPAAEPELLAAELPPPMEDRPEDDVQNPLIREEAPPVQVEPKQEPPKPQSPDVLHTDPPSVQRRDPWGPPEQRSRSKRDGSKRQFPSLEVDTGPSGRRAQALAVAAEPSSGDEQVMTSAD